MTTPRILLDEQGNKWELQNRGTIPIYGDETKREVIFSLAPYIERKPLFTDLAGNPVHKGDTVYVYRYDYESIGSGPASKDLIKNEYHGPYFLHKSDCEKWVNSNVKTMTREEAFILFSELYKRWNGIGHFMRYIERLKEETCLLTKDKV